MGFFNDSYQENKFYRDPCHCIADSGSDAMVQFHHSHRRIYPHLIGHSNEQQTCASRAINGDNLFEYYFLTLRKLFLDRKQNNSPAKKGWGSFHHFKLLKAYTEPGSQLMKNQIKPDSLLSFRLLKVSYLPLPQVNKQIMRSPFSASLGQLELSFHTRSQTLHPDIHPSTHSFACSLQFHLLHSTD